MTRPTSDTVLSLVTCYPFAYVGHAPRRFIVQASPVALRPPACSGDEVSGANGDPGHGERRVPWTIFEIAGVPLDARSEWQEIVWLGSELKVAGAASEEL